jgi:hypothetical protein
MGTAEVTHITGSGTGICAGKVKMSAGQVSFEKLSKTMYPKLERMGIPKDNIFSMDHQMFKAHYINDALRMVKAGLHYTLARISYNGFSDWRNDFIIDSKEPPYGILVVPVSSGIGISALEKAQMKRLYIMIAALFKVHDLQIVDKVLLHKLIEGFVTEKRKMLNNGSVEIKKDFRDLSYIQDYRYRRVNQRSPLYQCVTVRQGRDPRDIEIFVSPMIDGNDKNKKLVASRCHYEADFFPLQTGLDRRQIEI